MYNVWAIYEVFSLPYGKIAPQCLIVSACCDAGAKRADGYFEILNTAFDIGHVADKYLHLRPNWREGLIDTWSRQLTELRAIHIEYTAKGQHQA